MRLELLAVFLDRFVHLSSGLLVEDADEGDERLAGRSLRCLLHEGVRVLLDATLERRRELLEVAEELFLAGRLSHRRRSPVEAF
jgi:hypothetical protein